jgi:hypothetical protein
MPSFVARPLLSLSRIIGSKSTTSKPSRNHAFQRVYSTSGRCASKRENLPPPLPPSNNTTPNKKPLNPVEAKQRYLESKKRTEEFLQDPQKKISQLQSEMNQVKDKLEKEVYNKSMWRRLTDPLRRKQHSLINMIAATFAYVLAFQLHLKRQANQKLTEELQSHQQTTEKLKQLLRSLLEDEYLQDLAEAASEEIMTTTNKSANTSFAWSWTSATTATPTTSTSASERQLSAEQIEAVTLVLRRKLEERIGDEGLDEDAKKERNIERIWKENQQTLDKNKEEGDNDDVAELLAMALETENEEEAGRSDAKKRKRVFDM